jgi:glucosamine--fructose-6-phosphate aminotransferase (isomerizing)
VFESETDTEVIAQLVHSLYDGHLFEAVHQAVRRLHGAYAIAVVGKREPERVVGARLGSPLVVGIGDHAHFLASDGVALSGTTDRIACLQDGDVVSIDRHGWRVIDAQGELVSRKVCAVKAGSCGAELGPYRHFMQK